ncbi:MAG: hypothetical protein PVJ61_03775 [Dehalococcoidia bacterium]|jgi:hypothetical protein
MNPEQRIKALEDEVKVLKNEVKAVLLDIREHYLGLENPFSLHRVTPGQEHPADIPGGGAAQDVTPPPEETEARKKEPATQEVNGKKTSSVPQNIDLITIVGLTQWSAKATSRLGKTKTEALIEVYHTTGRLSPSLRDVLIRLTRLSDNENGDGRVGSREYLAILTELDSLMNKEGSQFDASLLSILADGEGRP